MDPPSKYDVAHFSFARSLCERESIIEDKRPLHDDDDEARMRHTSSTKKT